MDQRGVNDIGDDRHERVIHGSGTLPRDVPGDMMAAETLTDTDAFYRFFGPRTRAGTSLVVAGTTATISFSSALSSTPFVVASPDQNIKIHVGRVTTSLFDVTSSVAFSNTTIHYHAWE